MFSNNGYSFVVGLSVRPFSAIIDVSPCSICSGDNFVSGLGVELKCLTSIGSTSSHCYSSQVVKVFFNAVLTFFT